MITLPFRDGELRIHGRWPADRYVIILHREHVVPDDALVRRAIRVFTENGLTVVDHQLEWMHLDRDAAAVAQRLRLGWLPRLLPKLAMMLSRPRYWKYLSKPRRDFLRSVEHRLPIFEDIVRLLGPEKSIAVFGRSAGARIASMRADELGLESVVCLGYPFRAPGHAPEPARYAHLAAMATPCLILQGVGDGYGGAEVTAEYPLSRAVEVHLVDTDHEFRLREDEWDALFARILRFMATAHAKRRTHA